MSLEGDTADKMMAQGIEVTSQAIKLAGHGAKNLAAILLALLKDNEKLKGRTTKNSLLRSRRPLIEIPIPKKDLQKFAKLAKEHMVVYAVAKRSIHGKEMYDIVVPDDCAARTREIVESMKMNTPKKDAPGQQPAAQQQTVGKTPAPAEPPKEPNLLQKLADTAKQHTADKKNAELNALAQLPPELLAAFILSIAKENREAQPEKGNLANLFVEGKEVKAVDVPETHRHLLKQKAEQWEVPVHFQTSTNPGMAQMMVLADDIPVINRMFKNVGLDKRIKPPQAKTQGNTRAAGTGKSDKKPISVKAELPKAVVRSRQHNEKQAANGKPAIRFAGAKKRDTGARHG